MFIFLHYNATTLPTTMRLVAKARDHIAHPIVLQKIHGNLTTPGL
jgi:hypothetical protein